MDHYELSLQWRNPDFTEGYVENAQIYRSNKMDPTNKMDPKQEDETYLRKRIKQRMR